MDDKIDFSKYKKVGFADLQRLAQDNSISMYEKIGFPDAYRKGREGYIFEDIVQKLGVSSGDRNKVWLDIGPGCTDVPKMVFELCKQQEFRLLWADSKEMLDLLPDADFVEKTVGYFPDNMSGMIEQYAGGVDYIVAYSVLQCGPFYDTSMFRFIDTALTMLRPGGKMLVGDISNVSKRRRFFATETGAKFHREFMKTDSKPEVNYLQMEPEMDDGVLFSILLRYRGFGFETYLLPQNERLPMYNRREDILICRI